MELPLVLLVSVVLGVFGLSAAGLGLLIWRDLRTTRRSSRGPLASATSRDGWGTATPRPVQSEAVTA
ncbi:MAG: hypothetical protein P4L83_14600 [Nevskia sp.]|nr:hypothetical protein [Nevskia sp.]